MTRCAAAYPLVRVTWLDSTRFDGWQDVETVAGFAHKKNELDCESTAYLLHDLDDRIVIAHTVNVYGAALGAIAIPKAAITSLKQVGGPHK